MEDHSSEICELQEKVARLEEKLIAANNANEIARQALSAYQASSNEWRAALNDQRGTFVTFDKLIAALTITIGIGSLIVMFFRK